jgi:hypothetical protein
MLGDESMPQNIANSRKSQSGAGLLHVDDGSSAAGAIATIIDVLCPLL